MKHFPLHNRHREQFMRLLHPHTDALFRLAWRFSGNRHDAEDLLQDLLLKLYPRLDELAAVEQLRPWLCRVLYRMFIDEKRRRSRSPLHQSTELMSDGGEALHDPQVQAPDRETPDNDLEQSRNNMALWLSINSLPEDQRDVVILHDMEGYPLREIETILDCPIGTLKSRLHRARRRLRNDLKGKI